MRSTGCPRVRGNDWGVLKALTLGDWRPRRTVSVVVPAFGAHRTLPYTLAALAQQSYPAHLLEVVVVDDGSQPPLALPDLRPEHTRLVRAQDSWGRANACREGALSSEGEVIHWLDADMVPRRDQVEAQLRWHHQIDHAVVLGHKTFVDADNLPDVAHVAEAVQQDALEALVARRWTQGHEWVEQTWARSGDLKQEGFRAFHVHVGATASVGRELYDAAGGMDPDLKLGEDIELGYRLALKGGVLIGDREARSWHLGRSTLMQHEQRVKRYNAPHMADRVPDFRRLRQKRGRTYRVPLMEVVVRAAGRPYEQVKSSVDGVLRGEPGDIRCALLGPWSALHDDRRSPLDDDQLDLRLLHAEYGSDARVVLVETLSPTAFPTPFRLHLPGGWRPAAPLGEVARGMQRREQGLHTEALPDGQIARLEVTAAVERALRLRRSGEDLDDVVAQVSVASSLEHVQLGLVPATPGP
jgi:glycosyltransferase involved in cell wall biosynthesis